MVRHLAGEHEDAEREYTTAVNALTKLVQEDAADPYARDELAMCYEMLGDLARDRKQDEAAQKEYALALEQRNQLPDLPLHTRYRRGCC